LGNRITSIGEGPFSGCTSLTAIIIESSNTRYSTENGVLYNKNKTILMQYPEGKTGAFTIPNSVKSIGDWLFTIVPALTA
jgi:hypothetical protein